LKKTAGKKKKEKKEEIERIPAALLEVGALSRPSLRGKGEERKEEFPFFVPKFRLAAVGEGERKEGRGGPWPLCRGEMARSPPTGTRGRKKKGFRTDPYPHKKFPRWGEEGGVPSMFYQDVFVRGGRGKKERGKDGVMAFLWGSALRTKGKKREGKRKERRIRGKTLIFKGAYSYIPRNEIPGKKGGKKKREKKKKKKK